MFFLLALDFFVVVLLTLLFLQMNDLDYYAEHFSSSNINAQFETPDYPVQAVQAMLDYYQGATPTFAYEGFTEQEISHLADVKQVLGTCKAVLMTAALVFVCLLFYLASTKGFFSKATHFFTFTASFFFRLFMVSLIIAASFFLLALLAVTNFTPFFSAFHGLFFPGGNWMFAPDSTLIILFPETFFMEFFMNIVLNTLLVLAMLFLVSSLLYLIVRSKGTKRKIRKNN